MTPRLEIIEEPISQYQQHRLLPSRFEVSRSYEVVGDDPATAVLKEQVVNPPWLKAYEVGETLGQQRRLDWDISNRGLFGAYLDGQLIGSCVLKYKTLGPNMPYEAEGCADLSDIRILQGYQGQKIGVRLFEAGVNWARQRGCQALMVYTENINVRACRLYQGQGCKLIGINRGFFAEFPDEIELVWRLEL